ncbi:DNA adenine methylase [Desulfotruncus alcoholivorax]|uniref:DNA adenine methylase n=1 Tax=Desulfotruncus alcoholivorax TaxID=265477 RepID=UPI00042812E6|nr:DNA adenine methylase [Desulfotruncus alcoholivorax]
MPIPYSDISPLRYPGSKAFLVDYIDELLKENYLEGCIFIEPYAGSAIVSLELLRRGTISEAILVERDPLIFCFWKCVFQYTYDLIDRIDKLPVTLETWDNFQDYKKIDIQHENQVNYQQIINLGLAGLFFNRTTFSGILNAGPIGGRSQSSNYKIDCRFNKNKLIKKINKLSELHNCVTIILSDAVQFLKKSKKLLGQKQCFIYADPPYYKKGKDLYRYWYNYQDHQMLAKRLLSTNTPWLVSYDNHDKIKSLYKKAPGRWQIYIDYTLSSSSRRKEMELIISNLPIPPKSFEISLIEIS